jgi:2,3-bisphosphoglycerate-dependent phosphoglycerate mutase
VDVPLAPTGIAESHRAAGEIKKENFTPDIVYTSTLKRAIKTAWNVLEDNDIMHTPVIQDWRLNERMYGALQGESPASCGVLNLGVKPQRRLTSRQQTRSCVGA